jgi:signal transduction histidine kinase
VSVVTALGLIGWPIGVAAVGWTCGRARAGAARRESVARACHELRGPITAARLGVALVLRSAELPPAALRAIDLELSRAALALEDLARDGAGGEGEVLPHCGPVDVPLLLRDCVEASRASAHARGVRLELRWSGAERAACGDRVRLAQATRNLIANAIEHGGGAVVVRGQGEGDTVRIEVTDSGRGLPAPVAELVRRPRAGRGTRGRGLAIAAGIAERHGGRLAAAPSDRGARLVLELPTATDAGRAVGGG